VVVATTAQPEPGLRERKRRRTRAALIDAGRRLFEERGYDATTIADIAAAADIGTRTFFAYFESKEQLLFPESDHRVQAALDAIADRAESDAPAQVLLRALDDSDGGEELVGPLAQLRLRLIRDVPAVQARALRRQLRAQSDIAAALTASYPDLDLITATSIVGAFVGAVSAAVQALPEADAASRGRRLREAVAIALGFGG